MNPEEHAKILSKRAADNISLLVHRKCSGPNGSPNNINTVEYVECVVYDTGLIHLINHLQNCIELLNEVRTGEDFEGTCHTAAADAQALLDAQVNLEQSRHEWQCGVCVVKNTHTLRPIAR